MLVLTRKAAETIVIGENIVIKVMKTGSGTVKIGIEAPSDVHIMRGELLEAGKPELPGRPVAIPAYARVLSDQYPHVA
ncbi:MAG: carbon storage regulator [Planctomycetaceae bacterium]|nr:carbon storage regulator [Planctomycetaceae bacterium]